MKQIQLSQGKTAFIDDDDYNKIIQFNWYADKRTNGVYARTTIYHPVKSSNVYMHRFILNITDPKILVDHIDRNTLNNQKSNLRTCDNSQNTRNRVSCINATSKYLGVCWDASKQKWMATIGFDNKRKFIGRYDDEIEAAKAYDYFAIRIHGEFANPNFK